MLEHCCGDLFSHKSRSEVGYWCWAIRPGSQSVFQFIPKVFICQTQNRPSDYQIVKRDSSLQTTRFYCSRVQWHWALHHSSRRLALSMVILGLCAAARPWKHISWSSQWTLLNSSCADVASRGSLELGSECCKRGQKICSNILHTHECTHKQSFLMKMWKIGGYRVLERNS